MINQKNTNKHALNVHRNHEDSNEYNRLIDADVRKEFCKSHLDFPALYQAKNEDSLF